MPGNVEKFIFRLDNCRVFLFFRENVLRSGVAVVKDDGCHRSETFVTSGVVFRSKGAFWEETCLGNP